MGKSLQPLRDECVKEPQKTVIISMPITYSGQHGESLPQLRFPQFHVTVGSHVTML